MSADPMERVFVRTIAKSLKQCDPASLETTVDRLRRAADSRAADVPRRLLECEKHAHGIEIHLRAIVELVEARARGAIPGIERARFARRVAEHRARFAERCAHEWNELPTPADSLAVSAAAAFRARQENVSRLFERLAGLFAL